MTTQQPEALRLAGMLTADEWPGHVTLVSYARGCVAELLRQHARITELEAQLEAIGAGGVNGPLMRTPTSGAAALPEALYADAVKFAKEKASISYVQRKCRCSYNEAARMLERMVSEGIIATYNGRKEPALAAGQAVAPAEPTPDELRAIAREARNSSGSASDDCGSAMYVLYGWRAAISKVAPPAMDGGEDAAPIDNCTDPYNCKRCKAHPNHRAGLEHAGIPAARAAQKEGTP